MLRRDIVVLVVSYDSGDQLGRCLDSVRSSAREANLSTYIVVVDNHENGLDQWVEDECDQYISMPSNPGFGAGNNAGLAHALSNVDFTRLLLLNPDAWLHKSFMPRLKEILTSPNASDVLAPLSLLPTPVRALRVDDLLESQNGRTRIVLHSGESGISIYSKQGQQIHFGTASFTEVARSHWVTWPIDETPIFLRLLDAETGAELESHSSKNLESLCSTRAIILNAGSFLEGPSGAGDLAHMFLDTGFYSGSPVDLGAWCGSAVVLSRRYLEDVGGFSSAYFMYYEDSDLSIRGLRQGYLTRFDPALIVHHDLSSSTSAFPHLRRGWIIRSRGIFAARGFGRLVSLANLILRVDSASIKKFIKSPQVANVSRGGSPLIEEIRGALVGIVSRKSKALRG